MKRFDSIHAVVFDLDGLMFNTEDIYLKVGSDRTRNRGRDGQNLPSDCKQFESFTHRYDVKSIFAR